MKPFKRISAPLTIRGHKFTKKGLARIRQCVRNHFAQGRTYISERICRELKWKQPNGWLKDRACRDVLLQLERMGYFQLPRRKNKISQSSILKRTSDVLDDCDLTTPVYEYPGQISLEFAKGNSSEKTWNELVNTFHYLGHQVIVGRCIKYLIKSGERILGAVAFSSPAWGLAQRDVILHDLGFTKSRIRNEVINNCRFLILPFVMVPNLASRVLSLATSKVVLDWLRYYSIEPQVVETFVQPSLYKGTCYTAANWIDIGLTKGYRKNGSSYENSQEPKKILLYGLNRRMRRVLTDYVHDPTKGICFRNREKLS